MRPGGEPLRIHVGYPTELHDALGDGVGVLLLLLRVLEELVGYGLTVDAAHHEVVVAIAERADDLGGERIVEHLHHPRTVRDVCAGHRPAIHVLASAAANVGNVQLEPGWYRTRRFHDCSPFNPKRQLVAPWLIATRDAMWATS